MKCVNIPVSKYGQVVDKGSANLTAIHTATGVLVELEKGERFMHHHHQVSRGKGGRSACESKGRIDGMHVYSVFVYIDVCTVSAIHVNWTTFITLFSI